MKSLRTVAKLADSVYDVCFSPDGQHLVASGRDGRVGLWSRDGVLERSWRRPAPVASAVFSPEGDRIVIGSPPGGLGILRPDRSDVSLVSPLNVESVAFTPDGQHVLVGGAQGEATLVDLESRRVKRTVHVATRTVSSVSFSPAGDLAVLSAATDGILLLEYPSLKVATDLAVNPYPGMIAYRAVFAPDGTCAASVVLPTTPVPRSIGTAHPDAYEILLWRPGEERPDLDTTLLGHVGWAGALTFSRSSRLLASGGFDGALLVWDPAFHHLLGYSLEHDGNIHAVACSPDGALLATASADGTVKLWDVTRWSGPDRSLADREVRGQAPGWKRHLEAVEGGPGRSPLLTASQRIADALLAITDPSELRAELDEFASYVTRTGALSLADAVTQTLEIWGEQAKRENDEAGESTAWRCERVIGALNRAGAMMNATLMREAEGSLEGAAARAPSPRSIEPPAKRTERRGRAAIATKRAALEPAGGAAALIADVAAGVVGESAARATLASARLNSRELARVAQELVVRWHPEVLRGTASAPPVIAAAKLALEVAERGPLTPVRVGLEQVLGRLYSLAGDRTAALQWVRRALDSLERLVNAAPVPGMPADALVAFRCQLQTDLGNVLRNAGDLLEARRAYTTAIELAREHGLEVGRIAALSNLAIVDADLGRFADQVEALLEARAIARSLLDVMPGARKSGGTEARGGRHGGDARSAELQQVPGMLAAIESGLGHTHMSAGEFAGALSAFHAVLRYARRVGDVRLQAVALGNVGLALAQLGKLGMAERRFRAALDLATRLGGADRVMTALLGLAGVAASRGDGATEERYAREAVAVGERTGSPAVLLEVRQRLAMALENRAPAEARAVGERAVAAGEELRRQVTLPQEAERLQALLGSLHAMTARIEARAGRWDPCFEAAERARAALLLRRLRRPAATGRPIRAAEALALLERLGPRCLLASYLLFENELLLFTARSGEALRVHRLAVSAQALDEALEALRREVKDSRGVPTRETWMDACVPLVAPLAPLLHEDDVLVVVPSGRLHAIPLHAVELDGERLLSRCSVVYLPSVSALATMLEASPGPPRVPRVLGQHFEREAQEVAAVLGAPVEPPENLDRDRFLEVMRAADAVHVSAYGFFSHRDPRSSGVIIQPSDAVSRYLDLVRVPHWKLTPGERTLVRELAAEAKNGIVSVADLDDAGTGPRFVTLSACESGVVEVDCADDPTGLVPTLIAAGANTVVATLWLVDAETTREFMARFYEALSRRGWRNGPQALRAAALETMRSHPHPYHWAPFVMFGGLHEGVAGWEVPC